MRSGWETVNNRWQQLVLNYSRENQFDLLKKIGFERPDWTGLGQAIAGVILVFALSATAWIRWSTRPHDAWSRQRAAILAELRRLGLDVNDAQSPLRWAAQARERFGPRADALAALLAALDARRYGPQAAAMRKSEQRAWRRAWQASLRTACAALKAG
jgi:hypothetical protein